MVILTLVFWVKNKAPLYENTRSRDVESVRLAFAASSPSSASRCIHKLLADSFAAGAHTTHTRANTEKPSTSHSFSSRRETTHEIVYFNSPTARAAKISSEIFTEKN